MSHNTIKVITDKEEKLIQVLQEFFELYSQEGSSVNFKLYHNKGCYLIELEEGTEFDYLCFLVNYIRWAELDELYDQKSILGYWKTYYKHQRIDHEIGEMLNVYVTKNDQNCDNVSICNSSSETCLYDFGGKVKDQKDDGFGYETLNKQSSKIDFIKEFKAKVEKIKTISVNDVKYLKTSFRQKLNLYRVPLILIAIPVIVMGTLIYEKLKGQGLKREAISIDFIWVMLGLSIIAFFYSKNRSKFKKINVRISNKDLEKIVVKCQEEFSWNYSKKSDDQYYIKAAEELKEMSQEIYVINEYQNLKILSIYKDCNPGFLIGRNRRNINKFVSVLAKENIITSPRTP